MGGIYQVVGPRGFEPRTSTASEHKHMIASYSCNMNVVLCSYKLVSPRSYLGMLI